MEPRTVPDTGVVTEPPRRAGRNLPAAIGVGAALAGVVVASLLLVKEVFLLVVVAAVLVAVVEVSGALAHRHLRAPRVPVLLGSVAMLALAYTVGAQGLVVAYGLTALAVLLWRVAEGRDGAVPDVTAGVLVVSWLPLLAGTAVLMLAVDDGALRVLTFIAGVVANDVGGYVAGVLAGRHPMAPTVSPKKSWEGLGGSLALSLVVGVVCVVLLLDGPWWGGVVLGLATGVTATFGDLAESMLKRDLGIKDMGSFLPGHGGVMDRLDSLLVTAPVAWLVLAAVVPVP